MSGHAALVPRLMEVVGLCCTWGIKVLTVYLFSTENWFRPQMEVEFLMELYERMLGETFMRNEVRVSIIGNLVKLPISLQNQITKTTNTTKENTKFHLLMAINYVKDGLVEPEDINKTLFNEELETSVTEFPYPDLLIRLGGELRLSNFLAWQLAYTELYFTECLPWVYLSVPCYNYIQNLLHYASLENELPEGLIHERIPKHVAVCADGHRRWEKEKGLPSMSGHEAMVPRIMEVVGLCCTWGIEVLTVYLFSTENWIRSQIEVDFWMEVFERMLREQAENFMRNEVRVSIIGNLVKLPISLQNQITKTTDTTKKNTKLHLLLGINYSGRDDILQACRKISHKVKDGLVEPEDISESLFNGELETAEIPYPDLFIRTSGVLRLSNFFAWQLAYTELYFTECLWPDFGEREFTTALQSFQRRQRRFGN
ncbi:hypothetical protein MKX01_005276 [Papaver californicum]|nr:hypothetical protein MKX01_005276 [Papaver californicum]